METGKEKMALAKKCDRCEKFYDEYNFAKDDKNINGIMTLNLDAQDHYYIPGKPIKVYCEYFLTDKKNGNFDTIDT